jgi:hypothetical protein
MEPVEHPSMITSHDQQTLQPSSSEVLRLFNCIVTLVDQMVLSIVPTVEKSCRKLDSCRRIIPNKRGLNYILSANEIEEMKKIYIGIHDEEEGNK